MADGGTFVCEICGKPAVRGTRNTRITYDLDGLAHVEYAGPPHYWCEEHEREPINTTVDAVTEATLASPAAMLQSLKHGRRD